MSAATHQLSGRHSPGADRSELGNWFAAAGHCDTLAAGNPVNNIAPVVPQLSNRYISHPSNVSRVIHSVNRCCFGDAHTSVERSWRVPRWVPTARYRLFALVVEAAHGPQKLPHSRSSTTVCEQSTHVYSLVVSLGFCASYPLLRSPNPSFVTTKPRKP